MSIRHLLLLLLVVNAGQLYSQTSAKPCCTIIDLSKEDVTFTIRDRITGRIQQFKPDALEGAELKVGDSVDVVYDAKKIISIKGNEKSYQLLDAPLNDSCCVVMKVDSASTDSLFTVVAKNSSTGENIHFKVPALFASQIKNGEIIFTRPSHGYAMIATAESDTTKKVLYGFPLLQN